MTPDRHVAIALIIACALSCSVEAQVQPPSLTPDNAPVTAGAPSPTRPVDAGAAVRSDVPIGTDQPAAVTEPGAPVTAEAPRTPAPTAAAPGTRPDNAPWTLAADPDAYSIVNAGRGVSLHKPMYLLPATYSPRYTGSNTEVLFAISLKLRFFSWPLYLGYTQKSFLEAFNDKDSKPFRENDFNPEIFYRFIPADRERWFHLGSDFGFEHESNGQSLPDSRSWNRLYVAPFWAQGKNLVYWKFWYRIPEDKSRPRDDPRRDDNPDIQDYYGYSELHVERQLFDKHLASVMVRYNPTRGRGAANLQYTIPGPGNNFFWSLYVFQGYGESLLDYNRSVTRVGLGISITR